MSFVRACAAAVAAVLLTTASALSARADEYPTRPVTLIVPWERQGQNIGDFPHLKRWFEAIKARPAVIKAYEWTPKINPGQGGIRTAEERAILFGQTAQSVAAMAGAKQ